MQAIFILIWGVPACKRASHLSRRYKRDLGHASGLVSGVVTTNNYTAAGRVQAEHKQGAGMTAEGARATHHQARLSWQDLHSYGCKHAVGRQAQERVDVKKTVMGRP